MSKKPSSRRMFLKQTSTLATAGLVGCSGKPAAEKADLDPCGSVWERPPKQKGNNLNVILLVSDTFRADNLECYGSKWIECPYLNTLAKDSIIFDDVYPEGLPTLPVRRTLMTGRRVLPFYHFQQHEPVQLAGWHPLYNEDVTLSETLREAGYVTALVADVPHMQRPAKNFHRGYTYYEWIRGQEVDYYTTPPRKLPDFTDMFPTSYLNLPKLGKQFTGFLRQYKKNRERWLQHGDSLAEQVSQAVIRWLKDNHQEGPFFLHLEGFDSHEPWDPPKRFLDKYMPNATGPSWPEPPYADINVPEEGIKRLRANYAGESSCVDHWYGQILKTIGELGLFDNSVVIFTSDHGALLGEQGQFVKGPTRLRGQVTHIPLLMRLPKKQFAGKRVKGYAQHLDIMPTILGRLGLKPPSRVTGADLWPMVTGEAQSSLDHVVYAYGWIAAVRTLEWNYSRAWRPEMLGAPYAPQLYDLTKDPEELTNVADKHADVTAKLDKLIDDYMASGEGLTRGSFHEKMEIPKQKG